MNKRKNNGKHNYVTDQLFIKTAFPKSRIVGKRLICVIKHHKHNTVSCNAWNNSMEYPRWEYRFDRFTMETVQSNILKEGARDEIFHEGEKPWYDNKKLYCY